METKRVTEDFMDRSSVPWTPGDIAYIMKKIEDIFEECDEALENAEMERLGYEKQPIDVMTEHMAILISYVFNAYRQCCDELDQTLYVGFKNGATEILSNIVLDEITTDNTFNMQEYVEVNDAGGSFSWTQIKPKLTMKDFLDMDTVVPGQGAPVIENMETIGWFKELFRADYENKGASVASVEQLLDFYLYAGEYDHKGYHPVRDFLSGIADFTIIIPFIESICGYDFITQEKLTDYESGMKFVNAAVGAVTLGQGTMALKLAGAGGKEIAAGLLKTWAVDALADASAYTVGYACDELGLPEGVTFLASLVTGCMVSVEAGKYVFTDPVSGIVVEKMDVDGMQALVKETDVDLGDMVWGGKKSNTKTGYEYLDEQLGNLKDKVKINQYQSAENVNDWWENRGYKSPYREKTVVQNITLMEDTKFVRVYDRTHSSLEGGWVMKAEDIRGLTAKEIQIKYALEYEPVYVGEVELKTGDTIRLGEVGSNFGFDGGGIQIDLQQQYIGEFTELGKIEEWGIK